MSSQPKGKRMMRSQVLLYLFLFPTLVAVLGSIAKAQDQTWKLTGNSGTSPNTDFLGTTDNRPLVLRTNAMEVMRINNDGRVGIGITEPRTSLHILGRISTGLDFRSAGTITFFPPDGFAWFHIDNGPAGGRPIGRLRISHGGNPGEHEILTLLQNGNVGIGTESPDAKLQVSSIGDFSSPQVHIQQTTAHDFARLRFNSTKLVVEEPGIPLRRVPMPLWDIAIGGRRNVMNFFSQDFGNVMTLTPDGKIGIRTEQPDTEMQVNGTATVKILKITGGSDLAEPFSVEDDKEVEAGTVMVIDESHPGKLKISGTAYDRKVAGVVSGAGGLKSGLTIQQDTMPQASKVLVAIAGRAYCMAESMSNPIEPGDLLTTSNIPGHAMKAVDELFSHGAIIGKAMTSLKKGKGLVLVLVNLQ